MQLLRFFYSLFVPGILFSAALYLHLQDTIPQAWYPLLKTILSLAAVVGLFLGWRFNRSRVLLSITLLLIVERALRISPPLGREYLLQVAPIMVPLNLVLYNWWTERGLFTMHGLIRLGILIIETIVAVLLYFTHADEVVTWLSRPLVISPFLGDTPLSQIALLVIVFCLMASLVRFAKKPEALEGCFFWLLGAVTAGFCWPEAFAFWIGVGIILLVIALIESSFKMAFNDELTGLPAHRALKEFLPKLGRRYTIALVDLDHFKKINDKYGHDVADQVLRMVATSLRRVGGGGRAFRYGGEEFAIIFPYKDLDRAMPHLEELRETIACAEFVVRNSRRPKKKPAQPKKSKTLKASLQVTVSIGAANRNDIYTTPELLIKAADQALYKAKLRGRNQICT